MRLHTIIESIDDLVSGLRVEYGGLGKLSVTERAECVEIDHIEVRPEYRNMGIGSAVVGRIKEYAKSRGKPVVLTAQAGSGKKSALGRFYSRLGFVKPGRGRRFDLPRHTHIS